MLNEFRVMRYLKCYIFLISFIEFIIVMWYLFLLGFLFYIVFLVVYNKILFEELIFIGNIEF